MLRCNVIKEGRYNYVDKTELKLLKYSNQSSVKTAC
jgi:hypothetical protein